MKDITEREEFEAFLDYMEHKKQIPEEKEIEILLWHLKLVMDAIGEGRE